MVAQAKLEPYIPEPLIRKTASDLIGWYRLTESDREEIEQFLRMRIVQAWPKFNPKRSQPQTYADRIIKSSVPSFIRDRTRMKRNPVRVQGTIEHCKYEPTTDRHHQDQIDLALDMSLHLSLFAPSDRQLAFLILDYGLEGAIRRTGMRPDQARAALRRMRQVWEECGMDAYFVEESENN